MAGTRPSGGPAMTIIGFAMTDIHDIAARKTYPDSSGTSPAMTMTL
jgi:hypothetical protein